MSEVGRTSRSSADVHVGPPPPARAQTLPQVDGTLPVAQPDLRQVGKPAARARTKQQIGVLRAEGIGAIAVVPEPGGTGLLACLAGQRAISPCAAGSARLPIGVPASVASRRARRSPMMNSSASGIVNSFLLGSTARTQPPSAFRRSTIGLPMKPPAPFTRICFICFPSGDWRTSLMWTLSRPACPLWLHKTRQASGPMRTV